MAVLLDLHPRPVLVPLKEQGICQQECPWLSNNSFATVHCLHDVAHHRALKSGSDWLSYRTLCNKVNAML